MTTLTATPNRQVSGKKSPLHYFSLLVIGGIFLAVIFVLIIPAGEAHSAINKSGVSTRAHIYQDLNEGESLQDVADEVTGSSVDKNGHTLRTSVAVDGTYFTINLRDEDGYAWQYDSRTNIYAGQCSSALCAFGIPNLDIKK